MPQVDTVTILVTLTTDEVWVMTFVTREYKDGMSAGWTRQPSIENIESEIARTLTAHPGKAVRSWRVVKLIDLPDRYFRDAWKDSGVAVQVDMAKAREIHKNVLRRDRAPLLATLDVAYAKADEAVNVPLKAQIAQQKQALRDVPQDPAIIAAGTPEELKAVRPAALNP